MDQLTERFKEIMGNRITDENEVKGNLVQTYRDAHENLFLIFENHKWAIYSAQIDYDECPSMCFETELTSGIFFVLFSIGFVTKEELEEQKDQMRKYNKWKIEERER